MLEMCISFNRIALQIVYELRYQSLSCQILYNDNIVLTQLSLVKAIKNGCVDQAMSILQNVELKVDINCSDVVSILVLLITTSMACLLPQKHVRLPFDLMARLYLCSSTVQCFTSVV